MKPVVAFLRERGIRLITYIPGRLIDPLQLPQHLLVFIKDLFQVLGLIINKKIPVSAIPGCHILRSGSINNSDANESIQREDVMDLARG